MKNLKNDLWLWGQRPSGYDGAGYGLPEGNRMTPTEGLSYFGIKNLARVKLSAEADNSFFDDPWLGGAEKLCLSLIGAGGEVPRPDTDEIIALSRRDRRLSAAVMDDFISEKRMKYFTPERLVEIRDRLHTEPSRPIELWSVLYERDFDITPTDRSRLFDVTTFWTWYSENLDRYDENLKRIRNITDGGRLMLGIYMYDFGAKCPIDDDRMLRQLEFVNEKYSEGVIEGAILCSNVIADIGLTAVDLTKKYLDNL